MKTKMTFAQKQILIGTYHQLEEINWILSKEWIEDKDKKGDVKLHSKCNKVLKRAERIRHDILYLLQNIEIEN